MPEAAFGYYGKLPLSREFLRHNAAATEVEEMDEWLQEGIHHAIGRLGSVWSAEFALAGPWNFLFFPEGGSRFLIGVLVPSRDQAGREFPFFVFLRVDHASFRQPHWLAPLHYYSFLDESRNILQNGWQGTDLAGLRSSLETLSIQSLVGEERSAEELYRQQIRMTTLREFWTNLLGDFAHPTKYYLDHSLAMCLEPLHRQPSKPLAWGLKLPLLPGSHAEAHDLPFWLDLSSRHLGYRREPALLLWTRAPSKAKPCMMVAFGKPLSNLVLFLIRPEQKDKGWYDLAPEYLPDTADLLSRLRDGRRELLDNGELSLESFLEHTGPNSR